MKLLIILSVVVCSYAAKLDRTYLPPASAASAGGSPGSLTAPANGPFRPSSGVPSYSEPSTGAPGSSSAAFGKFSASTFGQQPVSSYGQPDSSGINQPTGQEINQPSTLGYQNPSTEYKQSAGKIGFGSPNAVGSTLGQSKTGFGQTPTSFGQSAQEQTSFERYQPQRERASIDSNAEILRYENQNDGNTFAYSFETSNGITAEESGSATDGVKAEGSFSYTGDDGQVIRVTYTADENGYQPQGDHLPTPHPIPEDILRSIEENERAASAGTQEGAYNPDEDVNSPQQYNSVSPTYQGQDRDGSQYAYNQPQRQSSASQFDSPSFKNSVSGNNPSAGSVNSQSFNTPSQSASGFAQNGQSLTKSGYQYAQPQTTAQFVRQPISAGSTFGQYNPTSSTSNQLQGSPIGSAGTYKGFAPSASEGQTSSRPLVGAPLNGKPRGSISESNAAVPGFASLSGFGKSPSSSSGPTSQGSGQYQYSKSNIGSPMPVQSSPYQYNRPGQISGSTQQVDAQPGFRGSGDRAPSTQNFGSLRQPPSFTDEEGYKY